MAREPSTFCCTLDDGKQATERWEGERGVSARAGVGSGLSRARQPRSPELTSRVGVSVFLGGRVVGVRACHARYVSDFPDEALWDHPNTLLIPHLGASTEEAEEAAAAMAAETIRTFLETGTVVNAVNFPEVTR